MNVRTFVDTNVLVYLYDTADPVKRERAQETLRQERAAGSLVVSTQVLSETFAALTREKRGKPPITTPEVAERVVRFLATWTVVGVDAPMVLDAVALHRAMDISLWDALIVRAASVTGCGRLLSEDMKHGQEIAGVRIENPFR